jgi:hypothetical protein
MQAANRLWQRTMLRNICRRRLGPDDAVDKLKKQYYDYLGAKTAEIEEARQSRHYYHGDQWTEAEIAVLQRRKQPVVTSNRIERKINAVVGIVEKLRQDPKGLCPNAAA